MWHTNVNYKWSCLHFTLLSLSVCLFPFHFLFLFFFLPLFSLSLSPSSLARTHSRFTFPFCTNTCGLTKNLKKCQISRHYSFLPTLFLRAISWYQHISIYVNWNTHRTLRYKNDVWFLEKEFWPPALFFYNHTCILSLSACNRSRRKSIYWISKKKNKIKKK